MPLNTLSWWGCRIIWCLRTPAWLFMWMGGRFQNLKNKIILTTWIHLMSYTQTPVYICMKTKSRKSLEETDWSSVFSPPMWVCWRIRLNCVRDETAGCTLTILYENTLRLNHTFTTPGVHCVDISVHNDISKMETSFSINVKRSSESPENIDCNNNVITTFGLKRKCVIANAFPSSWVRFVIRPEFPDDLKG